MAHEANEINCSAMFCSGDGAIFSLVLCQTTDGKATSARRFRLVNNKFYARVLRFRRAALGNGALFSNLVRVTAAFLPGLTDSRP